MELHDLSALAQAAAIRAGQVTATELAEHYLRRGESLGPTVGAFVTMTPDLALAQAGRADEAVRSGAELGPLHGVVAPVKDLNLMAGVRMRAGSAVLDFVPVFDDDTVAAMRAGGLICTGKTNVPEFGTSCYTESLVAPPARTPWDLGRMAGGSSGGSATAVATGLAPLAIGSDGGGSIRIPASCCGVVGIKPTRGRVSNGPMPDMIGELGVQGPLARTVADAAALLDLLAGAANAWPAPPPPSPFAQAAQADPPRLRIGRYRDPVIAATDLDPEVLDGYEAASALLVGLGHEVVDVARPFGPDAVPQFEALWSLMALMAPVAPADEPRLLPLTRWLREAGARVTGAAAAQAVSQLRLLGRAAIGSMSDVDVILTPALAKLPALVGAIRNDEDPEADFEAQKRFTPFTSPYNISGQPAISVPLHWTAAGLPVGVQLVGRPFDECTIISLAAQLERAQPWGGRRHPLW